RVEAVNEGGARQAAVVVNYLHLPVRLAIDRLSVPGETVLVPELLPNGKLRFPPLSAGRAQLEGHVTWDQETDDALRAANLVRVYVNNFQQVPAELKPAAAGTRRRDFRVDILCNRNQDKQVEIE